MLKNFILSMAIVTSFMAQAPEEDQAELFDIVQGMVVETLPIHDTTVMNIEACLETISGIVKQVSPIPKAGYMLKIPLKDDYFIDNEWFQSSINEIIIIYPNESTEQPYILLFDEEHHAHFLYVNADLHDLFLKVLLETTW
ncbi:hypothetical protein AB4Y30_05735 [Ornithinibacillus sp. 4-3]|uniref:Group-specific protein n=1 Tax=Ornithinibacillus sp. 4-3 TaxID=3231488 RepID=A0AB39HU67_9BACI